MKRNNKLVLLGAALSMTAGIGILGASVNADEVINAGKYTQNVTQLQKIFTNKNKDFSLEEVSVENNKDNGQQPVYKLEGFNSKKTKEAKMKVNAEKTSDVIKNKTKKMDADDKSDAVAIDTKNVKKNPNDAINLAKKYANENGNATEWTLKMDKVNGRETPVYKIEFESQQNNSSSSEKAAKSSSKTKSSSSKKSSSKENTEKKTVKLNATNGNKISVENDD